MATIAPRVWFVTGAARGIGRSITEVALDAGDRVVATARRPDHLADLQARHPDDLLVPELDVRDQAAIDRVVTEAVGWGGRLDVVVNNAGYGLVGAIEEVSPEEAHDILATNALGPIGVCRAVLPHLRERGSGHIVQISTVGGVGSMPLLGLYNASKWALEGFSEALAGEVAPFGIRVTIAELGSFSTDWGGSSMRFAAPRSAYDELRTSLFGTPTVPWDLTPDEDEDEGDGTPDDGAEPPPWVAARAILAHVAGGDGPLRLLVGEDAPVHVAAALAMRRDDYALDARFAWPDADADRG